MDTTTQDEDIVLAPTPAYTSRWTGDHEGDETGVGLDFVADWEGGRFAIGALGMFQNMRPDLQDGGFCGVYFVSGETPSGPLAAEAEASLVGRMNPDAMGSFFALSADLSGNGTPEFVGRGRRHGGDEPGEPVYVYDIATLDPDTILDPTAADSMVWVDGEIGPAATRAYACGDMDGDGLADLCLHGLASSKVVPYNEVAVVFGPLPTGHIAYADLRAARYHSAHEEVAGEMVSGGGDLDGDGLPDLLVDATYRQEGQGGVYLVSRPEEGVWDLSDYPVWTGEREELVLGGGAGSALATGGDLDGDGLDDAFIGDLMYDSRRGRGYVVTGAEGGPLAGAHAILDSTLAGDWFGVQATMGDFDGDGQADLAVGASRDVYYAADRPGRVLVYLGPLEPGQYTDVDADIAVRGSDRVDAFGYRVEAGDIDGDGRDDLLVGAPFDDEIERDAGAVYLFSGEAWTSGALN